MLFWVVILLSTAASVIWHIFLPFSTQIFYVISFLYIFLLFSVCDYRLSILEQVVWVLALAVAAIYAYAVDVEALAVTFYTICNFQIAFFLYRSERRDEIVSLLVKFFDVLIVLNFIGFFWALFNIGHINILVDGVRPMKFHFLATDAEGWGPIRRMGSIFDEPGAFASTTLLVSLAAFTLGLTSIRAITIRLIALLPTFSLMVPLAGLVLLLFWSRISLKTIMLGAALALTAMSLPVVILNPILTRVDSWDALMQNNRFRQFSGVGQFFDRFNWDTFFGVINCRDQSDTCFNIYGDVTSNPFTPLIYYGVPLTMLVYFLITLPSVRIAHSRRIAGAAILLLMIFAQRPYFYGVGYGFLLSLCALAIFFIPNLATGGERA